MTTITPKTGGLRPRSAAEPDRVRVVARDRRRDAQTVDALSRARSPVNTPATKLVHALDEAIAWLRLTPLSQLPEPVLRRFTEQMPKIDLHRHLNGAIPIDRLLETARAYKLDLPADDVEGLRPHVQVTPQDKTLGDYLAKFNVIGKVLKSPVIIEALAASAIDDAARDNLTHCEIRFAPQYMASTHGLDLEDVIKSVCSGVKRGVQRTGVTARLIVIITRHTGVDEGAVVAQLAAKYQHLGVVALDLAGDETHFPPGPFAEIFRNAKKAGLSITIHAGEARGADSVRSAVIDCGAERVGHATRAIEDPEVVALLRERGIVLESCPTSNVQTGAIAELSEHHIAEQLRAGLLQTLHTDNPTISGITLSQEFQRVITTFDLTLAEVEKLLDNSVDAAFLSPRERMLLGRKTNKRMVDAERALVKDIGVDALTALLDATMERHGLSATARAGVIARIREGLTSVE